jgi:hypothetical protein
MNSGELVSDVEESEDKDLGDLEKDGEERLEVHEFITDARVGPFR